MYADPWCSQSVLPPSEKKLFYKLSSPVQATFLLIGYFSQTEGLKGGGHYAIIDVCFEWHYTEPGVTKTIWKSGLRVVLSVKDYVHIYWTFSLTWASFLAACLKERFNWSSLKC